MERTAAQSADMAKPLPLEAMAAKTSAYLT